MSSMYNSEIFSRIRRHLSYF